MRELLGLFSLSTEGDVPVGLGSIREETKLNQPNINQQKQYNFTPLFQQQGQFVFSKAIEQEQEEKRSVLEWISYIFEDEEDEEDEIDIVNSNYFKF